jgi:OPA family glycerol-3-phosphate transporter-like MFS transporter
MGVFISSGYFWATTVGSILIRFLPLYWIFLAPALMVGIVGLLVWRLVYDNPSSAGFGELDLGKTAQIEGETQRMNEIFRLFGQVLKKREIRDICVSEFCTGVVRQGMMYYFAEYLAEVYGLTRDKSLFWWTGVGFMMSGITGAFLCDKLSGTYFNHRRAPVAFIFYLAQVVMLILLGFAPGIGSAYGQGLAIFLLALTSLFIFGVHGILSATSSLDFGGKKAVGMVVSLVDGVQYCGGGLAIWAVGHILHTRGWDGTGLSQHPTRAWYWVAPLVLAALCGAARIHRLWHTTPHGEQKTT